MRPIRLTAVLTHPVQYYSPWFRDVAAHAPGIELTVIYATEPTPEQQGTGFGRAFTWDVPLREGYRSRVIRPAEDSDHVGSDSFFGLDVREIGSAIRETSPDVVLVPGWHSITLVRAIRAARRMGVPVLFRGDTNLATAPTGLKGRLWRVRTRRLLGLYDAYLSPGRRVREFLTALDVDPWQIVDTPHVVDNERFAAAARPFQSPEGRARARAKWGLPADGCVLLFAGKLEEKKRPLDIIRAAAVCDPRASVLIVGAGELEAACRAEADRLEVTLACAGFLNQTAMGEAYAAADMLVLPSDGRETWGMVVNEALATGLPVVVSDKAGCADDLADDETGARFACGDVPALADAVMRVSSRAATGSYPAACRERASRFSISAATAGLVRACQLVAKMPEAPRVVACCGGMVTVTGMERMTFTVLRGLRNAGARVHCTVNDWENHRIVPLVEDIGGTWSLGAHSLPLRRHNVTPGRAFAMLRDVYRSSAALWRAVGRTRATHVLLPEPLSPVRHVFSLIPLRLRGVRVVMRLANAPERGAFYRFFWRVFANWQVSQFVCNSEFTKRELQALGVPARKVTRIYNALRFPPLPEGAGAARRPNHIIFVGQIIPVKGLDLLLEAVALLNQRGVPATLAVAGDIDGWTAPEYVPFRQALRARVAQPDLAGRVEFLGWRDDIVELMATASVHCAPSRLEQREAFGIVNLEAKRAGTPSVVFPSGALGEVIAHKENGWVCSEVTPDALAEGLSHFLTDESRREEAGRKATESLAQFAIEPFDEAWRAVFDVSRGAVRRAAQIGQLAQPSAIPAPQPSSIRIIACCGGMVTVTGMERMTFTVLKGMREAGARVHCIVNNWEHHRIVPLAEEIGATWSEGGHALPLRRRNLTTAYITSILRDLADSISALWRVAEEMRPTHVLLPDHVSPVRHAFVLAYLRARGVRVIMHLNNAPERSLFYQCYWRLLVNPQVSHFVCNSDFTQRELHAVGVSPRKTERIYNALRFPPLRTARPARRPNHIMYVGQIIPVKGLDLLLDAVALLRQRGIPATLALAGDIDGWTTAEYRVFRNALRARAGQPDLAGHVEFLGWREDIVDLMGTASVHCTPSRLEQREAFGLVNIEAKRAGTPSVVSPSGALPELIAHKEDGWVCSEVSAEAFAEGLAYFLTDADRLASAGKAASRSLARFDIVQFDKAWRLVFGTAPSPYSRASSPAFERPMPASGRATK